MHALEQWEWQRYAMHSGKVLHTPKMSFVRGGSAASSHQAVQTTRNLPVQEEMYSYVSVAEDQNTRQGVKVISDA